MVNVIFSFITPNGLPVQAKVTLSPYGVPTPYSGSIITSDSVVVRETTGNFSCSLYPTTYKLDLFGKNTRTECYLSLPTSSDYSTVNAADYLTNLPPGNYSIADYALTCGTASYAITAGGNANAQFYNPTTGLYYNIVVSGTLGNEMINLVPVN